jgi:hypothetical protein
MIFCVCINYLTKAISTYRIGFQGKIMMNARTYSNYYAVAAIIEAVAIVAVRRAWRVSSARLT